MNSEKVVILITEGETDYLFYKRLLRYLQEQNGRPKCHIDFINIRGVGRFETKVPAKYKNEIKKKHPSRKHVMFMAYDSDVFELKEKPPVNWKRLEKKLRTEGADSVLHLKAIKMIEDWFVFDINGICKNLKIRCPKKLKGSTGFKKLENLFKSAQRIYQKGYNSNNFIDSLDMGIVYTNISNIIKPLVDEIYK